MRSIYSSRLLIFGLLFVFVQAAVSLGYGQYILPLYLMDILAPAISLGVVIQVIRAHTGPQKGFWLLIGTALFCEMTAQLIWGSYEWIWQTEAPDIGIADIFWVSQSLIYLVAFYGWVRSGEKNRYLLDSMILVVSLAVVSWEFLIKPIYQGDENLDLITISVDLIYPITSLLMVFILTCWLLNGERRMSRGTMRMLAIGCLSYMSGDTLYMLLIDIHSLDSLEPWIDTFWTGAAFCMAVAGLRSLSGKPGTAGAEGRVGRVIRFSVPYIGLLLLIGILVFYRLTTDVFVWGLTLTVLLVLVRQIHFLTEREMLNDKLRQSLRRLERIASCDSLTGLLNRRVFELELEGKLSGPGQEPVAVLYFDLDKFKPINDNHGHRTGDLLLQAVAERLSSLQKDGISMARLGGDEFAIAVPLSSLGSLERLQELSEAVVQLLSKPYRLEEVTLRTSPSVGIALYPQDARTMPDLLDAADQAMYEAKRRGGRGFAFYRGG
ncbi:GGDEF domain-containing protein [Paenibacillus mucilaginosus]|uniref:Diguanylate cyclase n=1 Tax=Paenibacillus mucilaginosus (strain KNP414) TaxID=1036673 RepID=F8F517_PAEMK|nr:GGDEF domain-containing protein [Paenibacillus mucilaginosus]AEI40747.1 diguanylate cyclase [Paenibacillus mucilaginosus KNP414]MCG7211773.1 GGDEF domain-containing protein [Paenibacillus mucilaginosus]WDM29875.1 GGDEF domain-containing protein [Paenibacillus mucilaginosus]